MTGAQRHTMLPLEPPLWSRGERVRPDRPHMPLDRTHTALRYYKVADAGEDLLRLHYHNLDKYRDNTLTPLQLETRFGDKITWI